MPELTIDSLFNAPFYEGSAGSVAPGLVPAVWSVAIAGHVYKADWTQCKRGSTAVLRDASDTSAVPNEASLSTQGRWVRYQTSFLNGAGQKRFDSDTRAIIEGRTDDRKRFNTSKGLDVWTEGQITLHHDTVMTALGGVTTGTGRLLPVGTAMYVAAGTNLSYSASPVSGGFSAVTGLTGTVNDITTDGTTIYVATTTGMFSGVVGGASVAIMGSLTAAYQVAQVVNGRLIAGKANVLVEISAALSEATVTTIRNTSFQWSAIWAGPSRFYAAGGTASYSEVYQVGVQDNGTLMPARSATPIPPGELVRAGLFHVSVCVLATSKGIRLAEVQADGGLLYGPLLAAPGDCRCLFAEDRFVWFGWTNFDTASTGVGRAALDVFSGPLVPAYASDLMATDQGPVTAVARSGGTTMFWVASTGPNGPRLARESSLAFVPTGVLDTGWISYGTVENKTFISVDLRHAALNSGFPSGVTSGATISLAYVDDTGVTTTFGASSASGTTRPSEPITLGQIRAERLRLQVTLTVGLVNGAPSQPYVTPTLFRWKLLAFPVPQRAEIIELALLFDDVLLVGEGEGQPTPFDTYNEYQYLLGLAASGAIVQYQSGTYTELVRVEGVQMAARAQTLDKSWQQGVCLVHLLTA